MSITQTASVLSDKEKALVGVALSIASGCRPCTERFVRAAEEAGACKRGIRLAVESALVAREQATMEMAAWAESLQGGKPELDGSFVVPRALWQAIYAVGAAFAQRDTTAIENNVKRAIELGASKSQLVAVLAQAQAILDTAGTHANASVANQDLKAKADAAPASGCACGSC